MESYTLSFINNKIYQPDEGLRSSEIQPASVSAMDIAYYVLAILFLIAILYNINFVVLGICLKSVTQKVFS